MKINSLAVATGMMAISLTPVYASDCIQNQVEKLTTESFEKVGDVARTHGCKDATWTLKCKNLPHDQKTLFYTAPPGYEISWYDREPILLEGNNYPGGHGDIEEGEREYGAPLTVLSLSYWCKSEDKLWGAGNWRRYKIVGKIKRKPTSADYQAAKHACSR